MKKPNKNTQYKISETLTIQHYTNGSFAFFNSQNKWNNIPTELGEKLLQLKQNERDIDNGKDVTDYSDSTGGEVIVN